VLDHDAIARSRRRRDLEEVLADEVDRERALREQVEAVVLEAEGPRIDAALRGALDPADAGLLDDLLSGAASEDDPWDDGWEVELDPVDHDAELARLAGEIAGCAARQEALTRAIRLLEQPLPTDGPAHAEEV
jgi:hypothetical protein